MAELRARDSVSARALEFTILTAARTSEALGAKWSEIDLDGGVWTVPADRMKGGKEHEVPLSKQVLEILEGLRRKRDGYVFPGANAKAPLSNMAMLEPLRGMDVAIGLVIGLIMRVRSLSTLWRIRLKTGLRLLTAAVML